MKKFLTKISIILLLLAGTLVIFWNLQGYRSSAMAALLDKHRRLDSLSAIHQRKIIIVGGSNCPFGFNSGLMAEQLHIPVINLGLHAGFGLKFILNDAWAFIRPGDIVLVSPEYLDFVGNVYNGESALNELIYGVYPSGILKLEPDQLYQFLSNTGQYMGDLISRPILSGVVALSHSAGYKERQLKAFTGCRTSFNQYGDISIPADFHLSGHLEPVHIDGLLNKDAFVFLQNFKRKVEQKGALFILTPQSLQQASFDISRGKIHQIDSILNKMGVAFHSPCEKYAFADEYIFNSVNHLNAQGQLLRTNMIIAELAPVIPR